MLESVSLGILGHSIPTGTHVCAFYSGPDGRDELVLPYLAEGIRTRQKCICVLETLTPAEVLARLGRRVDLGRSVETGALDLATPHEAYLRGGRFSGDDMLAYWGQLASDNLDSGTFTFMRATGEMPSVLTDPGGRTAFFRYEARLTEFVAAFPQMILCLYDLQRFGAEVLMDALRTHPMAIVDGAIHENPYYIDPGSFLGAGGLAGDGRLAWR